MSANDKKCPPVRLAPLYAASLASLPSNPPATPEATPTLASSDSSDLNPTITVETAKERGKPPLVSDAPGIATRAGRRHLGIDLSQPGMLRLDDVLRLYRVSRSTWYAGIKSGLYEPGIPIGPRCVAWRTEYIRDLIAKPPKFVRG